VGYTGGGGYTGLELPLPRLSVTSPDTAADLDAGSINGLDPQADILELLASGATKWQFTYTGGLTGAAGSVLTVETLAVGSITADNVTLANGGALRTATGAGNTALLRAYDVDGAGYTTFATLTANDTPTMDLADGVTKAGQYIYRGGGTDVPLADGGTGASLTASDGGVLYSTAAALAILAGTATANQALLSGAAAAPAF